MKHWEKKQRFLLSICQLHCPTVLYPVLTASDACIAYPSGFAVTASIVSMSHVSRVPAASVVVMYLCYVCSLLEEAVQGTRLRERGAVQCLPAKID